MLGSCLTEALNHPGCFPLDLCKTGWHCQGLLRTYGLLMFYHGHWSCEAFQANINQSQQRSIGGLQCPHFLKLPVPFQFKCRTSMTGRLDSRLVLEKKHIRSSNMEPETLPVPTLHMIWDKPLFLFIRQVRRFYPDVSNRYAGHPASPSSSLLGPLVDDSVRSWLMFQVTLRCLLEAVALTVAGVNADWIVSRLMPEMDSTIIWYTQ